MGHAKYSVITEFAFNPINPLNYDIIIADEISMLDKWTFAQLLNAVKQGCKIIVVGDENQINPINSNNLIYELGLLEGDRVSINRLNLNLCCRDKVAVMANKVLENDFKDLEIEKIDLEAIKEKIEAGNKVIVTSRKLVMLINTYMSSFKTEIVDTAFYKYNQKDEILILKNDYLNGVFNGTVCRILGMEGDFINIEKPDGAVFQYHKVQSATHFQPNYASTIHKAQGIEWDKVVVILQGERNVWDWKK